MKANGWMGRRAAAQVALALALAAAAPGARAAEAKAGGLAVAAPHGVWIHLGVDLPRDVPYVVARAVGDGDFAPLASVSVPAGAEVADARASLYGRLFPGLPPADPAMSGRVWEYVSGHDDATRLAEQNVPVAHLIAGTAYLDTTVVAGGAYRYRIERGGAAVTTSRIAFPGTALTLAVGDVVFTDARNGTAVVTWKLPAGSEPGGLIVKRRAARQGSFEACDATAGFYVESDTAYATVRDATVQPNALYEYEVALVDRFARPGPTSDPVAVTTFGDAGVPLVTGFSAEDLGDHRVHLRWKLSGSGYQAAVGLYRSDEYDGPFERLIVLPPGTVEYVDRLKAAAENAYYRIQVDGAAAATVSATVAAMARTAPAPAAPHELRARRAGSGVLLNWEGLGPYIKGYLVDRAKGNEDWKQVSGMISADSTAVAWTDTTPGLTGRAAFRYRVRAVGDADAISEPSPAVSIVPAPEFAVGTPSGLRAVLDDGKVMLFWDDLSASEPTLLGYDVFRRAAGTREFALVHEAAYEPQLNYWTDADATPGTSYEYAVAARDLEGRTGLQSPALPVTIPAAGELPSPASLRIVAVDGGVSVSWGEVFDARVAGYRVYRHAAGAKPQSVQLTGRDVFSWTDTSAKTGATYIYAVAAVDSAGSESAPSALATGRR